jgi:DinB superfamily
MATPTASETRDVVIALAGMPGEIERVTRGLSLSSLHLKPNAEAWSAQEILAHLRACAQVWGRSIERMLAEDHPTIRYVSPRGWIKTTDYLEQGFHDSLRDFSRGRSLLVEALTALKTLDWLRGATFKPPAKGRPATVFSYAKQMADHEVRHLAQIQRTLGR